MRIITILRICLIGAVIGVTASSRSAQAQTFTQPNQTSSTTISQTSPSESHSSSDNKSSSDSAIVTQTSEATKTESQASPASFRIPLSSRIFPSTSMQQ
jgi:hypothetical protein